MPRQRSLTKAPKGVDKSAAVEPEVPTLEDLKAQREDLDEQIEESIRAEESAGRAEEVQEESDSAAEEARTEAREEACNLLRRFGGHQDCFFGAITGQALHHLCTCGWNTVATDLERAEA